MRLLRLTAERPDAAIRKAVQEAIRLAETEWAPLRFEGIYPERGFGITTLRPKDIVYDGTLTGTAQSSIAWIFSISAASTWVDIVDITLSNDLYVVIEGVFSRMADPSITAIKFVVGGIDLPVINIEEMYTWDLARAYFEQPIIVKPSTALKIRAVGTKASTAEYFGFIGHTIAKRPFLIKE